LDAFSMSVVIYVTVSKYLILTLGISILTAKTMNIICPSTKLIYRFIDAKRIGLNENFNKLL